MASTSASASHHAQQSKAIVATGDWTKSLVHLAKTAELRRHALTLQMHTAHILSAHASLDQKKRALEDLKEQRNKLESERTRLLHALRQVNEDRDQADMLEVTINKECTELENKIQTLSDGEYVAVKSEVDKLRQELGQAPLPPLRTVIEERTTQYLNEMRLATERKRNADVEVSGGPPKKKRGRPPGSKTMKGKNVASTSASARGDIEATPAPDASANTD